MLLETLLLACISLSPSTHAVVPGMIRWSQFQFPFIRVPRQPSAASELVVALVSSSSADEKSYAMRWFEPLQTGVECHTSYMHSSIPWRNTTYPSTMLR
ncbi:hypothetical protein P8452_05935 [Trifolium repens]|nr:hypothetical protein P8452_05935 [Trifolium repens]